MSELEVMHRSQWLAALIGVAAFVKCGNACADLLTFEDLPSLLEQDPDGGGGYLDPDYHYFHKVSLLFLYIVHFQPMSLKGYKQK